MTVKEGPNLSIVGRQLRPSESEALEAVRVLIRFAGDDPEREGLKQTPQRVVSAYGELFGGYGEDPEKVLQKQFTCHSGENGLVMLRHISFFSQCEHHMLPFFGVANVAYLPGHYLIGLSKIVRLIEVFARRLQTQERLTQQVAAAISQQLGARGVAVALEAEHHCMTLRGVSRPGTTTLTTSFSGELAGPEAQSEFCSLIGQVSGRGSGS